jgi:hypothetical protein
MQLRIIVFVLSSSRGTFIAIKIRETKRGGFVMVFSNRKGTRSKNNFIECAQCGAALIAPVWSEHLSERSIRHLWNCDACGYEYETTVYFAPRASAQADVDVAA